VGHYCDYYAWVTPRGVRGLSDFTLILTDIATVDPSSLCPLAAVPIGEVKTTVKELNGQKRCVSTTTVLTTKQIPYRVSDDDPKRVELLRQIVVFGHPDGVTIDISPANSGNYANAASAQQSVVPDRVLQSSSPNAAFDFRNQQLQMQMQSQFQSQIQGMQQVVQPLPQ
jgi:hypothetical protein